MELVGWGVADAVGRWDREDTGKGQIAGWKAIVDCCIEFSRPSFCIFLALCMNGKGKKE